ncbi:hypothetical protein ADL05_06430 [Nocardiopsis sp. NRRL B-16309]|nr:hypothetical protein ADL05_06430 [Nocardiopsis sp. NRRL B-16309]
MRLLLLTDTHIGAAQTLPRHAAESDVDLHVDREPRTGVPRLRATTLAGLLRHELTERTGGTGPARALLGAAAPTADSGPGPGASALDIDDARAELPDGAGVTVRTGTRVDPASGAVRPGRTWQWEVLPAGTVFTVPLRLHVPGPEAEADLLGLLLLAAAGFDGTGPGRHVGGRTGRGYGRTRAARWSARRHDLTGERGWFAYHARTWEERWADVAGSLVSPAAPVFPATPAFPGSSASPAAPGPPGSSASPAAPGSPEAAGACRDAWGPGERHAETPGVPGNAGAGADLAEVLARCLDSVGLAPVAARAGAVAAGYPDRRHRAELRLRLAVAERPGPPDAGATDSDGTGLRPGLLMIGDVPADARLGEVDRAHRHRPAPADPGASHASGASHAPHAPHAPHASRASGASGAPGDGTEADPVPVLGDTALFALVKRIGGRLVRDAAEHLGGDPARWRAWNAYWWGSDAEDGASGGAEPPPSSGGPRPQPSRIRLRAVPTVIGGAPLTTTRLTVDALFGDAVDGRLYTNDLHCGGTADVVLDVRDPDDAVRGMLALLVRELATVPFDTLGSGGGSGNGRLTATRALLTTVPGDGAPEHTVDVLAAVRAPDTEDGRTARRWLAALRARLGPDRPGRPEPARHTHSTASEEEPHR